MVFDVKRMTVAKLVLGPEFEELLLEPDPTVGL